METDKELDASFFPAECKFGLGLACLLTIVLCVGLIFINCATIGQGSKSPMKYNSRTSEVYYEKMHPKKIDSVEFEEGV